MTLTKSRVYRSWACPSGLAVVLGAVLFSPFSAAADSTDRWQALTEAGVAARERAQYEEAERLLQSALHEVQQVDAGDARVAATLNHLGLVYHARKQYERAKPYYEQALARWEQSLGSDHAVVASALNNLAEIYQEEGAFEQAEAYYLRSLAIEERVLGCGHPDSAVGYNNLAGLYRK